jgi:hypothetical protein
MFYSFFGDGCSVYETNNTCEFDSDYGYGGGEGDYHGDGKLHGRNFGYGRGIACEFDYGDDNGSGRSSLFCLLIEEGQVK